MITRASLAVLSVAAATALPLLSASAGAAPLTLGAPPFAYAQNNRAGKVERSELDLWGTSATRIAASTGLLTAEDWSGSTGRVYFAHGYGVDDFQNSEIDSIGPGGGTSTTVQKNASAIDVSPDGTTYVYQDGPNLFLRSFSGGPARQLTGAGGQQPRFSPDGKRVAFLRFYGSYEQIYLLNTDGTGLVHVSQNHRAIDSSPVFSPDGKRLLFIRSVGDEADLYAMNLDGSHVRLVVRHALEADWAPNGWIAYIDDNRASITVLSPGVPGKATTVVRSKNQLYGVSFQSLPVAAAPGPSTSPTVSPTPSSTGTPTATPTATTSPSSSPTATPTATPSTIPSTTPSTTPTGVPAPTQSPTASPTPSQSLIPE